MIEAYVDAGGPETAGKKSDLWKKAELNSHGKLKHVKASMYMERILKNVHA